MAKTQNMFKFFCITAIVAILCTLAATIFMLVAAATPADKSYVLSGKFSGENSNDIVVEGRGDEVSTQGLRLTYDMDYAGKIIKPALKFSPAESTDREVIWEVLNTNTIGDITEPCISLNAENGELTYRHLGSATIKVSLKNDPSISTTYTATCMGTNPKNVTSLTLPKRVFLQGESSWLRLVDQNGELVAFHTLKVTYSDGGDHFSVSSDIVSAKKVGKSTMTVSHPDMQNSFTFDVEVVENPAYIPLEELVANENAVPDGQTYYVKPNVTTDFRKIVNCMPAGSGAFQTYVLSIKNPAGKKVIRLVGTFLFQSLTTGEAEVTITSRMDPSISITLTICVYIDEPTKLQIITSDITVVDRLYSLKTIGDEFYVDNVTYEVVKGKAQLDGNKFRPTRLGKLVIRATYDDDPSLYTDITLNVKLFDTFAAFVRKALGHFSLFAVLGFGYTYVFLFLFKRKWVSAPLALPTGLLLAMASEGLQLTAEGRYGSWTDVGVDFVGFAIGIAVALLLFGAIYLFALIFKGNKKLISALSAVNAKTLFLPSKRANALAQDELAEVACADVAAADDLSENAGGENEQNAESDAEKAEDRGADEENSDIRNKGDDGA